MHKSAENRARGQSKLRLLAVLLLAIALLGGGWVLWQSRLAAQLDREVALIESKSGRLYFSDQIDDVGEIIEKPVERNWSAHWSRTPINLNLHKVQGARECLEIAANYHGLWQIDLSESDISDADLAILGEMTQLRHLFANDTQLGDGVLEATSKMSDLETLDLSRCKITAAGLAKWRPPPRLKAIFLIECDISDGALASLANHPTLEILRLCDTKATSNHLKELGKLAKLEEIDLSGTLADGESLPWLKTQYQLSTLKLAEIKLTPEEVIDVCLHFVKLQHLDLAALPVTDKAIRYIARARRLKSLGLSRTPFVDEMALHFFNLNTAVLQDLEVDGTPMTAEGVVRLIDHMKLNRLVVSEKLLTPSERDYILSQRKELELIEIPIPLPTP